jgi:hypothetical protein
MILTMGADKVKFTTDQCKVMLQMRIDTRDICPQPVVKEARVKKKK